MKWPMEAIDYFEMALGLAIMAETDEQLSRALALADEIAPHLTDEQIDSVKAIFEETK